jgi:hypothetical protein
MIMTGKFDGLALAKIARERWPRLGVLRKSYRKADIARAMRAALAVS